MIVLCIILIIDIVSTVLYTRARNKNTDALIDLIEACFDLKDALQEQNSMLWDAIEGKTVKKESKQ